MRKTSYKLLVILGLLFFSMVAWAVPDKELWPVWLENNPHSTARINHQPWQNFLDRYVVVDKSGNTLVRYSEVLGKDYDALESYLEQMSEVKIDQYNRMEQFAYWVNVYNALTIAVVLRHYPVKSIRDIDLNPSWFSGGPWDAKLLTVNRESLSLNDIEHRILRPIWQDPRIHYVLNCASVGSPNLQPSAFKAKNVDSLLEKAALDFVNNTKGVKVFNNKLIVSKIYGWFKEDFGGTDRAVIDHLKHYAKPNLSQELDTFHRINKMQFDWLLNNAE